MEQDLGKGQEAPWPPVSPAGQAFLHLVTPVSSQVGVEAARKRGGEERFLYTWA